MIRPPVKLPRLPIDFVFTAGALLLSLAAGRAVLMTASTHDVWLDVLFLGSVTLFLLGAVRFLVRSFDIEQELDELPAPQPRSPRESDPSRK